MKLDSTTMASNSANLDVFKVGSQVRIVTMLKRTVRGEVVSFDYETKTLVLKSPSVGQHGRFDLQLFNMEYVGEVDIIGDPKPHIIPEPLPAVTQERVANRIKQNVLERKKMRKYVGENVSREGQMLMDSICKTIEEAKWENDAIVVMDAVIITPPYTVEQCQLLPGKDQAHMLTLIRKMVDKHVQDERCRRTHSQNDTRRSMSPSPAPSSSSTSSIS